MKKRSLYEDLGAVRENDADNTAVKIDTERVKQLTMQKLRADGVERVSIMKKRNIKLYAAAAVLCAVTVTSAFASEAVRGKLGEIISYFNSDKAEQLSDAQQLERLNVGFGESVTKGGYTLTLDNVAADDNYVNVFYTLKSEMPYGGNEPDLYVTCLIDGKAMEFESNHNRRSYYSEDNQTLRFAEKYNISTVELPDKFSLELVGDPNYQNSSDITNKIWQGKKLTDNEKAGLLYIKAEIDKSAVRAESITKKLDIPLWQKGTKLTKFVYSPFGSQLVVTSAPYADFENEVYFAAFDETGKSLDILNTGERHSEKEDSVNSHEILKVTPSTKQLTLVPIIFGTSAGECEILKNPADVFPSEFAVTDTGRIVGTGMHYADGEISVDYYNDGFAPFDPQFEFYDESGNEIPFTDAVQTVDVHYDTESYTMRLTWSAGTSLENRVKTLGCLKEYEKLDFDKAIKVDIQ